MVPLISIADVNSDRVKPTFALICLIVHQVAEILDRRRPLTCILSCIQCPTSCILYSSLYLFCPIHCIVADEKLGDFFKKLNAAVNSIISLIKNLQAELFISGVFFKKHICKSCNIHDNHLNSALCKTIDK